MTDKANDQDLRNLILAIPELQRLSWTAGLMPPEEDTELFHYCGAKDEKPSALDLEFATKEHPNKKVRELQAKFFKAVADEITMMETDLLAAFKLPDIDTVRRTWLEGAPEDEKKGTFKFTSSMSRGLVRIVMELQKKLIGTDELYVNPQPAKSYRQLAAYYEYINHNANIKQLPPNLLDLPLFLYYLLSFNSIGIAKVLEQILTEIEKSYPPEEWEVRKRYVIEHQILPSLENQYFKAMMQMAGDRVRSRLSVKYIDFIRTALRGMAKEGISPLQVAHFLHREIGEGSIWHWLRLTRSESVLALNAAFDGMSKAAGIQYVQWSALANSCEICASLDGKIWRLDESPEPVTDTHPYCYCARLPLYILPEDSAVQRRWDRASPYEEPYSAEEIARLRGR